MTIYEIDKEIAALLDAGIDEETGELLVDTDALEALQGERDQKVENLALAYKNMTAEAKAIRAEEEALAARRRSTEAKAERARKYLDYVLAGEKFKTARVAVSYRKNTSVRLAPDFIEWAQENAEELLRYKAPEANKTEIAAILRAGGAVHGAELIESQTMSIK